MGIENIITYQKGAEFELKADEVIELLDEWIYHGFIQGDEAQSIKDIIEDAQSKSFEARKEFDKKRIKNIL